MSNLKFFAGEKVYVKRLLRNLIVSHPSDDNSIWICIDPAMSMNANRCALFRCREDEMELGWR